MRCEDAGYFNAEAYGIVDDAADANAVSKGLTVQGFLMLELVYF